MCTKTKTVSDAQQALLNAARYGMQPSFFTTVGGAVIGISNGVRVYCDGKPVYLLNNQGTKFMSTFSTAVEAVDYLKTLYHY